MRTTRQACGFLVLSVFVLGILVPTIRAQDEPDEPDDLPPNLPRLAMTKAVVCKSIAGHEDYEVLPGAELTAEEKLLVYYRPLNYRIVRRGKNYAAHLMQDGQVRRKGEKKVLLRKKNLLDYAPKQAEPLQEIYLRNTFSLKGLAPGEYEYDIILRDENRPGPPAIQAVRFRVIPPSLPKEDGAKPKESPKAGAEER